MRVNPKPMPEKTLTALRESIEHWKRMRLLNTRVLRDESVEFPSVKDCPLCALFYKNGCEDCPVSDSTGAFRCAGTPYASANAAFLGFDDSQWLRCCDAMIEFLESLLPENCKQEGGK